MILILSEELDASTNEIIDWLNYYKKDFIRINYEDHIDNILIEEENIVLHIGNKIINFKEVDSFWYRKGNFSYSKLNKLDKNELNKRMYLFSEWKQIQDFIFYKLKNKNGLYNSENFNINKLIVLDIAKEVGLLVPSWYIADYKRKLLKNTIIKPIGTNIDYCESGYFNTVYTEIIKSINYTDFFATFFQNNIQPKYELRSVFINDNHWTMAIHNLDKNIDYRKNYDNIKCSPFELPNDIAIKVVNLMNRMELKYGAVDFIVDIDNNYYFLEINPFGQFGMVSIPCNYFIEKEIAKIL